MFSRNRHKAAHPEKYEAQIALAGNPNVGKSTIFNALTGHRQHTGNWSGKTVENAAGIMRYNEKRYRIVDLPGTYSLHSVSQEECVAREYLLTHPSSTVAVVADAGNIERNLNLVLQILENTSRVVLCLNMMDEANKRGIQINTSRLEETLGIPVIPVCAHNTSSLSRLRRAIVSACSKNTNDRPVSFDCSDPSRVYRRIRQICDACVVCPDDRFSARDRRIDRLLTQKSTGIPIMLLLLGVLFWITIVGANYPSMWLSALFDMIKGWLMDFCVLIRLNTVLTSFLIDGIYTTLAWVVSVMFPPMAIFFPLFSLLEDFGILPRIAFNMDGVFRRANASPKQSLTMAMGIGCNACGVMGCRIIEHPEHRNIAIVTNSMIPCNGRLPALITVISMFFSISNHIAVNAVFSAIILVLLLILAIVITLLCSYILSLTVYPCDRSGFILELPPYRKPQILRTIRYSLTERAVFVLLRAISVAIPAGALIWLLSNVQTDNSTLLAKCVDSLQPIGLILGLDGAILIAFLLGFPANETVIPVMLMAYLSSSVMTDFSSSESLHAILVANGWTIITAICFLILCIFHYPCSTTCITIYKETRSIRTTLLAIILPTVIGVLLCLSVNGIFTLFHTVF